MKCRLPNGCIVDIGQNEMPKEQWDFLSKLKHDVLRKTNWTMVEVEEFCYNVWLLKDTIKNHIMQ